MKYVYLFPLTQTINSATSTNLLTYMKVSSHLSLSVLSCVHHVLCVLRAFLPFLTSCLLYACALRALLAYRVFRALLTLVPACLTCTTCLTSLTCPCSLQALVPYITYLSHMPQVSYVICFRGLAVIE